MNKKILEVVYTWPNGRQEVRYRRVADSDSAQKFVNQILKFQKQRDLDGLKNPYSYRFVKGLNR